MKEPMRVVVRHELTFDGVGIWLMHREPDGIYCVDPMEMVHRKVKDYPMLPEPSLKFDGRDSDGLEFLKGMAQGLAEIGFLPDLAKKNEAEIAAVRYHLEDMRRLVFPPVVLK